MIDYYVISRKLIISALKYSISYKGNFVNEWISQSFLRLILKCDFFSNYIEYIKSMMIVIFDTWFQKFIPKSLFFLKILYVLSVITFVYLSHYSSRKRSNIEYPSRTLKSKNQKFVLEQGNICRNRLLTLWFSGDRMNPISRLVYQLNLHPIAGLRGRIASIR